MAAHYRRQFSLTNDNQQPTDRNKNKEIEYEEKATKFLAHYYTKQTMNVLRTCLVSNRMLHQCESVGCF